MLASVKGKIMKRMKIPAMVAAAAVLAGSMAVAPAYAVPTLASKNVAEAVKPAKNPYVSQIRYYHRGHGHGHWRHHGGGNWGPWVAGGLLGLGLGAALTDGYGYGYEDDYAPRAYYGEGGFARCEATFKTFDPDSGTYMGYDGHRHRCPYI
jgi:opacity protein-like surface antigen